MVDVRPALVQDFHVSRGFSGCLGASADGSSKSPPGLLPDCSLSQRASVAADSAQHQAWSCFVGIPLDSNAPTIFAVRVLVLLVLLGLQAHRQSSEVQCCASSGMRGARWSKFRA